MPILNCDENLKLLQNNNFLIEITAENNVQVKNALLESKFSQCRQQIPPVAESTQTTGNFRDYIAAYHPAYVQHSEVFFEGTFREALKLVAKKRSYYRILIYMHDQDGPSDFLHELLSNEDFLASVGRHDVLFIGVLLHSRDWKTVTEYCDMADSRLVMFVSFTTSLSKMMHWKPEAKPLDVVWDLEMIHRALDTETKYNEYRVSFPTMSECASL